MWSPFRCSSVPLAQYPLYGGCVRGYIGIGVQPVAFPEDAWQKLGISGGRGLLIIAVAPDSAATESGLMLGDVIVAIDGNSLQSGASLQSMLDGEASGNRCPSAWSGEGN